MPQPVSSPKSIHKPRPQRDEAVIHARRQAKRRREAQLYPLKVAGVVLAGMVGAYLVFVFLAKVVHPYRLGYEEGRKVAAMQGRFDQQSAENAILQKRIDYLKSEEGKESEARHAGFHKPGEIVYLMKKTPDNPGENL